MLSLSMILVNKVNYLGIYSLACVFFYVLRFTSLRLN